MNDLVSITDAARELGGVTRTSLTRYVDKYAGALNPQIVGRRKMVSLSALRRHRSENLGVEDPVEQAATTKALGEKVKQSDARTRKAEADATRAELDLAERMRHLVPAREVIDASLAAIVEMDSAADKAMVDTAEAIAAALGTEARLVRPHLKGLARLMKETFSKRMYALQSSVAPADDSDAPMPTQTPDRAIHA